MNPERNRGGMTVNALMNLEFYTSIGIPVVLLALLSWLSTSFDHFSLMIAVLICAVVVLLSIMVIHYVIQARIRDRIQQLTEVCRDYGSGDRTIRAVVNGGDDFAVLAMSINTLLDNQNTGVPQSSLGVGVGSDAAALQAQIEKLLQEVSAVGDGDLRRGVSLMVQLNLLKLLRRRWRRFRRPPRRLRHWLSLFKMLLVMPN